MKKIAVLILLSFFLCLLYFVDPLTADTRTDPLSSKRKADNKIESDSTTGSENETEKPKVALTFDDGPNAKYTPVLLDGLKERNIRATFFLTGENLAGKEDIVLRMKNEGHLIGNHTFSHIALEKATDETARLEVEKTSNRIYEITGEYPVYLRPPYGSWRKNLEFSVTMLPVFWTLDTLDWQSQNVDCICSSVEGCVRDGDIILMHDEYETSVEAALEIADWLQESGYCFVTVDELLAG